MCLKTKRPRRTGTRASATMQTHVAPATASIPVVAQGTNLMRPGPASSEPGHVQHQLQFQHRFLYPRLHQTPTCPGPGLSKPASAESVTGFSIEETEDAIRVLLTESQRMSEFKLGRHKLLGDEIASQGLYIVDVPSDGNCQFATLVIGLTTLLENPPSDNHGLRSLIVKHLLTNKESLEMGQQLAFVHGDATFREGVLFFPHTAMGKTITRYREN